jgi:hypothetical protein
MLKKLFAKFERATTVEMDRRKLAFKDNESAFWYACEYIDCTLFPDSRTVALVLDATGLPHEVPDFYIIKVASKSGGVDVVADPANPTDVFKAGDLVSFWCSGVCDAKGAPKGLIASKLLPEFDIQLGWKNA